MDIFLWDIVPFSPSNVTEDDSLSAGNIFRTLQLYCTPVVVGLGVIGNALAIYAYRTRKLKSFIPSTYLTFLSVTDSVFLLTLLLVWSALYDVGLRFSDWWCLIISYFTGMAIFMSLWCITALSIERFVQSSQCWALARLRSYDTNMCAAFVVVGILIVGIVVYLNNSLTMGIALRQGYECIRLPPFVDQRQRQVLIILDLIFNFVLPYSLIAVFTVLNIFKYCQQGIMNGSTEADTDPSAGPSNGHSHVRRTAQSAQDPSPDRERVEQELSLLSIVLAVTFLVFSLPCRVYQLCVQLMESSFMSVATIHWQQLLLYVFFSRPAIPLFLALASCPSIRQAFSRRKPSAVDNHVEMDTVCDVNAV